MFIIFEDAHIRVIFKPASSNWLVVTFGDAVTLADGLRFFADRVTEKLGVTCLGFMAKDANWYPQASIRAALPEISYTLRSFGRRLFYGSSMGAYAAIKYSQLLGATDVVAYSPQWSIDPAECGPGIGGYDGQFRPEMAGMGIRPADIAGRINLFYDPWDPTDAYHYRMIEAAAPNLQAFRVPHAGHHVLEGMKGAALTGAVWYCCMQGDLARLCRVITLARHRNRFRRQALLLKIAHADPRRAVRLMSGLRARGTLGIVHPPAVFLPLLKALLHLAVFDQALVVLDCLRADLSASQCEALLHCIRRLACGRVDLLAGLQTAHGTVVFYNAFDERLVHVTIDSAAGQFGLLPVFPFFGNSFSALCVHAGSRVLACVVRPKMLVGLEPLEARTAGTVLHVKSSGPSSIQVTSGGFYMCAEPDGKICYDRAQVGPWEIFTTLSSRAG